MRQVRRTAGATAGGPPENADTAVPGWYQMFLPSCFIENTASSFAWATKAARTAPLFHSSLKRRGWSGGQPQSGLPAAAERKKRSAHAGAWLRTVETSVPVAIESISPP